MTWTSALTMLAGIAGGLGGAWIMGYFTLKAQETAQRNENVRHARRIACEAAIKEWESMRDIVLRGEERTGVRRGDIFPLEDFLIHYLAFADFAVGLTQSTPSGEITEWLKVSISRTDKISSLRKKLAEELSNSDI